MELVVEKVEKCYGTGQNRFCALRGVDLNVPAGRIAAVAGPSGSGKTTLLNVMAGLDTEYEGRVRADGEPLKNFTERQLAAFRNEHFGFVFQQFHLLDHLNVEENIALPTYFSPAALPASDVRARAVKLARQVGLGDHIGKDPTELSGGERQRVSIARALMNHPDVLFCDEPTGSLDKETGSTITDLFIRLNQKRDLTIVLVTHEQYIAQLADFRYHLEDGQMRQSDQGETESSVSVSVSSAS